MSVVAMAYLLLSGLITGGRFMQWTGAIDHKEREALMSAVLGWGASFVWCLTYYIKLQL